MPTKEPNGLSKGVARNSEPSIVSGKIGLCTVKSPIFEPSGQPLPGGEETVSAPYWAGEQPSSPAPTEGLIVSPGGKVTTALRTAAGFRRFGFRSPSLPTSRSNSKPLGEEARG